MKIAWKVCVLLFCLIFVPDVCYANEYEELPSNFSYNVFYPDNQIEKNGYFDLLMKPNQKQTISLQLNNSSNQEMVIAISINSAKTSNNGTVIYGDNAIPFDKSLKYDIQKCIKGPETVRLQPKSNKIISFEIKMPPKSFDGLLVGGIQLKPILKKTQKTTATENNMITNEYVFLIGIQLREKEIASIKPKLTLNSAKLAYQDGEESLILNVSNESPIFLKNMKFNISLKKKNESIYEYSVADMKIAPNTLFDLPISLADLNISDGEYSVVIEAFDQKSNKWTWKERLLYTKEVGDQSTDLLEKSSKTSLLNIGIGLVFFSFMAVSSVLFYKKVKRNRFV